MRSDLKLERPITGGDAAKSPVGVELDQPKCELEK